MHPTAHSDEALARRAGDGDEAAFAVLFERYHGRLERYCRSILRHDEDARDAAQSAMARALVGLRRHEGDLHVRPWLFRIAHNEAITLVRGRRHHLQLDDRLAAEAGDPLDALLSRERLARTMRSVRELPAQQRQALAMRLVGLSHDQIGSAIGVPAARARHAVFRARAALIADESSHDEDCSVIRALLDEGDGRRRRARTVRGHLSGCGACRTWDAAHRRDRRSTADRG